MNNTQAPVSTADLRERTDFRIFLANELQRRCEKNAKYSMRSFAKTMQISPSLLSRILRGRVPITEKMLDRLGARLGLSASERDPYRAKIKTRKKLRRDFVDEDEVAVLSKDQFEWIAEPYYDAILSAMTLAGYDENPTTEWLAQKLGLVTQLVQNAIERLSRLGLVKTDENGHWRLNAQNTSHLTVSENERSDAMNKYQIRVLRNSIRAVEAIPKDLRDHSAVTLAIDSALLPIAREKIRTFRRSLANFLESQSTKRDQVFEFNVGMFPVTGLEETK